MTALYLAATLKQLEAEYAQRQPSLIAQAGQAIAQWLLAHQRGKHFGILIGPGNNGADAVICAQHLVDAGQRVRLITDLPAPTLEPFQAARARLGTLAALRGRMADLAECDIIIDGLFGSGLNRPLDSTLIAALQHIDQLGKAIVAIDVPSGLDSNLGTPLPYALHATHWSVPIRKDTNLRWIIATKECS
ncbi:hypothetical protein JHS3_22330 [Jeongeupia sp. HS-3]|uniref:NAD(P)H-hydrate epimerase n=1 Tax=Jeongeupia sp. HS-3 TaxID=1009682 RepID=UPI0018A65C84|nr:NAD(P)H-hydrate epimerase [Jeongeupia sp. HS-3]BCL76497.1 hypothetical protein JHS3_22330 [Jeongeupia sp. HS-3]